jgi:hypothetical protein
MALWHDPLDELIDDLEHALPPAPITPADDGPSLEDLQWCVGVVLCGPDEERASYRFQRVEASLGPSVSPTVTDRAVGHRRLTSSRRTRRAPPV